MERVKVILLLIIIFLIGFLIGSQYQQTRELNWCVDKATYFLKINGYDIKINKPLIDLAVFQYKERFDNWLNRTVK